MRLIEGPESKLGLVTAATILLTATLALIEAGRLGFGTDPNRPRSDKDSPTTWFFAMVLIWVIAYPRYLFMRSKYGARNLLGAGLFSMLLWLASLSIVGYAIATAQDRLDKQIQQLLNQR